MEIKKKPTNSGEEGSETGSTADFFNYFGKERAFQFWFARKRTEIFSSWVKPFQRVGLVPDTISYIGIALLAGVVLYFVRKPSTAVLFLAGHLVCDGLDGVFARHSGKASQSGAFTDLVCDQLGMVVVAMLAIFHHLVAPLIGTSYIVLYLFVVVFGVIINTMGLQARITITSKYFLYAVYGIWAVWQINLFTILMSFFSAIMLVEVVVGYLRLKIGIRKKFDAQVRFSERDPYSSRLNYALNVAVPVAVLLAILTYGNMIPLRAMLDKPNVQAQWIEGPALIAQNAPEQILGIGSQDNDFLILVHDTTGEHQIRRIAASGTGPSPSFSVPAYISPAVTTFPVYGNVMVVADNTTRLLMGMDIEASFAAKRAVMFFSVPMGYLKITAMAAGQLEGRNVWLAANYLYTRRTCVIDPREALNKGALLPAIVAKYTNGGFPSGMAYTNGTVIEYNRSPFTELLYVASLPRLLKGPNVLDAPHTSLAPPEPDMIGPFLQEGNLVMVSRKGKTYRIPLNSVLPKSEDGTEKATGRQDVGK
jgi:phosphatidylglycerophosphate synthase